MLKEDETVVVVFLDDGPYASFRQHWLDRSGKKSFVCPEDPEDPDSVRCPLCDCGDTPRALYAFNVAQLDPKGGEPRVYSWDVGVRILTQLEKINDDPKIGPLSENYYAVRRTGKNTNATTTVLPVKERDLYDDHGCDPLEEADIAKLKRYDKSIISFPSLSTLKEMAREMTKYD